MKKKKVKKAKAKGATKQKRIRKLIQTAPGSRVFPITKEDLDRANMDAFDNGLIYAAGQALKILDAPEMTLEKAQKITREFRDAIFAVVANREQERQKKKSEQAKEYDKIKSEAAEQKEPEQLELPLAPQQPEATTV